MKDLRHYINESLNSEIKDLQKKLKEFDLSVLFNGKYVLDDSLPEEFMNILKSFDRNPSDKTLKSTWKMIYSKTCIEPLVGKLIGDNKYEYSTILQDRREKWDIKYGNKLIDVKASYNNNTHKFSISNTEADFIMSNNDPQRYLIFIAPEMKTWEDAKKYTKDTSGIQMYMISLLDMKEVLDSGNVENKGSYVLIPENEMQEDNRFRKFKK